jgi:pSer/pThr/pTyr-binding forkhead associated (FHA) protein
VARIDSKSVDVLRLVITAGNDAGRFFRLAGVSTIGRDPSAGIVLDDAEVSRRHAIVSVASGAVLIQDLESTNGVWVNDERIAEERAIGPGDRVRIGATELEVRDGPLSGPG